MSQCIVIIGNGIAGNSAAAAIRRLDKDVDIKIISSEKPPLYSPCAFYKYLAGDIPKQQLFLKKPEDYSNEGIEFIAGQKALEVDLKAPEVFTEDNAIPYNKLILATGSEALFPPIKGIDNKGVFPLKTLSDAETIFNYPAERVAVIGSGPIGMEAALALKKKGAEVSIIEMFDRILPRLFDARPASILQQIIEEQGLKVYTGERVAEIHGNGAVRSISTDKRQIDCDEVIIATGVNPNTELARKMGLEVGSLGGIKTDDTTRTSAENVYACGDCVESKDIVTGESALSLLWHNAKRQGDIAGLNCAGKAARFTGSYNATIIDISGNYAVSIGENTAFIESQDSVEVIEDYHNSNYYRLVMVNDRLRGVQLINKTEHAGLLASTMWRQDNLKELRRIVQDEKLLSIRPLLYRINQYLSEV